MFALKVEVNFTTGERAGRIDPEDPHLPTFPSWQNLDKGLEIRLVARGDIERFRGISGIEILEGEAAIDGAVLELNPPTTRFSVASEALLNASISQKGIDLKDLDSDLHPDVLLQRLQERGALGIVESRSAPPEKLRDVVAFSQRDDLG